MDELGLEEDLDFVTYCSNVECEDDLYRTFIKLCAFSPTPPRRSELILPLSREEDLITLPDESEQPTLPDESEHPESFVRGEDYPDSDLVTVFPANRLVAGPPDSSALHDSCLPTPTSVSSDRTLHIPPSPFIPDQIIAPFLLTSDPDSPPPPPAEIQMIPPPIPERIPLPPLNRSASSTNDVPSEPPPALRRPPKPPRTVITAPSQQLQNTIPSDPTPPVEPTSDPNLNTSGTISRNLSKNIPDKTFTLKDKSLVKSVLKSQQPLFLPRSLFLRQASCRDDDNALPRLRGMIRTESCPGAGNSYSMINLSDLPCDDSTSSKDSNEKISVHNIHSEAGILDLDDTLSDVVADKDVLVAEFSEEIPYTPAPPPEIRNIFNQVAGESSAAGSDQSADRSGKPQNINDSSYFSLSNDRERMAWIDRWVQDGDPSSSSPGPPRASPTPAREDSGRPGQSSSSHRSPQGSHQSPRGSQQSSDRAVETSRHERRIDGSIPERGIEATRDQRIEPSRNGKTISEREIGGMERGIETSEPQERGIEAGAARERGIDSNVREKQEDDAPGTERCIEVPSSPGETTSSTGAVEMLKVEITKENLPLGCNVRHIDGRFPGLYIMSVDEGSAAERDGRLKLGDKILEVNGVDISVMPPVSVLDVYNEMTTTAQVRLTIQRHPPGSMLPAAAAVESCPDNIEESAQKTRDSFEIILNKGQKGLGFTIATREYNTSPGYSPLFVKTVHRHGAAAADGRMKPNDVLLKVNGKSVVGMPQQAVVAMIRELKGNVQLTLQRHTTDLPASDDQTSPPRNPPPLQPLQPTSSRTRLSLDIPLVAPDGRPVGLGISVKGKSMSIRGEPRRDYGIFIKSILKGGAADLDGRLRADDQLITADGQALKGLTNKEAMQSLKQALERAGKMPSLSLVVSRKDCLNLSAERRTAKPYSSFKDSNQVVMNPNSLAADPNKYRALSLSSPNLGRKKKHHVEFDGGRGVAFSEDIQSIPQAGDVLESDEDVVFVGNLGEQADPFNRDCLFRKSMKKIDHAPITPNALLRRASSHDSLARPNKEDVPTILKKGVSQESVFSGKDMDPVYDTIKDDTLRGPAKINDSLLNALQNGKVSTSTEDDSANATPSSEDKPKSKTFLNFFSKKGNKKKDDTRVPAQESVKPSDVPRSKGATHGTLTGPDWDPAFSSSPVVPESHPSNKPTGTRYDREFSTPSRANVRGVEREQPRAPGSRGSVPDMSVDHKRSKSSDFYRDKEQADRNGGFIDHRLPPRERDHNMSRGPDRHSNRSSGSGGERKRGDRPPGYNYPSRDYPVRDPSRDHPVRDQSRDHPVREHTRDHPTREQSRDHLMRETSRDPRDNSRDPRDSRDRRYMETVQYRYGRGSPHHTPPPFYLDQQQDPGYYPDPRFAGSNTSLNKRPDPRPPHFQPMIPHPISHLQGRHTPEQLSDV